MSSLLLILIGTVLVNTFLITQSIGDADADRHFGVVATAIRIAGATLATLLLSCMLTTALAWQIIPQLLAAHLKDTLLLAYAVVVVGTAILLHRATRERLPKLRRSLASSPVLIVSNCLALGGSLLGSDVLNWSGEHVLRSLLFGTLALGLAFGLTLTMFAALNERIEKRAVPPAFRQAPITMISAGLLALALMGFTGLWRG